MTDVDIIILSWDRVDDTIAAITSAVTQEGVEPHVYVVDQGTHTPDLERLKQFCEQHSNVRLACNEKNNGVPGGRNQASAMGKSDYIIALDNDAVFEDSSTCARAVEVAQKSPKIGALCFRISVFDSPATTPVNDDSSWGYYPLSPDEWAGRDFETVFFVGAGHLLCREAFEKVGGYDDALFFMHEEKDLCYRLNNAGYRIEYHSGLAVRHKVSPQRRVEWKADRYRLHLRNKIYVMAKQQGLTADLFSELAYMLVSGVRSGMGLGPVRGTLGVIQMLPKALKYHRTWSFQAPTEDGESIRDRVALETGQGRSEMKPWSGRGKVYQLYCRLRWETDIKQYLR